MWVPRTEYYQTLDDRTQTSFTIIVYAFMLVVSIIFLAMHFADKHLTTKGYKPPRGSQELLNFCKKYPPPLEILEHFKQDMLKQSASIAVVKEDREDSCEYLKRAASIS